MAKTRAHQQAQALSRLEEVVAQLTQAQITITNDQSSLHSKLDNLIHQISTLECHTATTLLSSPQLGPRMKLDVPQFDGTNVVSWIFTISQFFDYHGTPYVNRLQIVVFYLDDPTLSWYNGYIVTIGFRHGLFSSRL